MNPNPVRLIARARGTTPDDNRARPDAVAHPGDVVTLSFETEHAGIRFEYVKVKVEDRVDGRTTLYRGTVTDDVLPALVPPEKLSKGSVLVFTGRQVFVVSDMIPTSEGVS